VTRRRDGGIDVLVHNAGGNVPGPIDGDEVEAAWYAAFDVHVHAAFHLAFRCTGRVRPSRSPRESVFSR
jgi:NAD(P)-dependent dehydrogenase (short-subunit alcohol dehydrogenase family)